MRLPTKTILAVGLALMFAACAQQAGVGDDDKLSKKEFAAYRDTLRANMESILTWADSTHAYLVRKERQIRYLLSKIPSEQLERDSIPVQGDDPPPPPCRMPPCPW